MGHVAAWVGAPTWKIGLDNLGTQQPCVLIYSALLPGITNVTDRAWHYGFYVWFIRAFEKRFPDASEKEFRIALRKADCLATLISARHAIVSGDDGRDDRRHGHAFPGRAKLVPAAKELTEGGMLHLDVFADADEGNANRYFKAPLGGLGQYYFGVLRDEYRVLDGDRRGGARYTNEIGLPLAEAFADGLDEAMFMSVVDSGEVTLTNLDAMSAFCPCAMQDGHRETARTHLVNMIMSRSEPRTLTEVSRRLSMGLALDFLANTDGTKGADEPKAFLAACYSGALPTGSLWNVAGGLDEVRALWGLYLRNEMLSLAWEAIFKTALDAVDGVRGLHSIRQAATWCLDHPIFDEALTTFGHEGFDPAVLAETASLPPLTAWDDPNHELALWRKLPRSRGADSAAMAMRLLVALVARHESMTNVYGALRLNAGALTDYPLTLDSLGKAAGGHWRGQDARGWLDTLISTALSTHQRVAIRKLGQSGDDTLMFRIGDDGMFVERRLEEAVETQPRLTQAFQLLRDLGLTAPSAEGHFPRPTAAGMMALEEIRHG